mgnify:CR=1 FL=1
MLQEWKRKGKKFRHVKKDGEETTELSVKIRAAKFRDLPMSLRILIVNLSLFLILCAVFFMAGAYLYAPQAAGRNYVEACLAGDWNSAYDVCQFPDSTFLSRKNYVNAMTWKAKQDGTDGQETPEIKSFFMRRKQNLTRQAFPGGIWGTLYALHPIPAVHPGLWSCLAASFRMTGKTLRPLESLADRRSVHTS